MPAAVRRHGGGPGEGPHRRPRPPPRRARDRRERGCAAARAPLTSISTEPGRRAPGDRRRRRVGRPGRGPGGRRARGGRRAAPPHPARPGRRAQRRAGRRRHPAGRVPRLRRRARARLAGSRCWRASRTRPSGWSRRASSRCRRSRGWLGRYEAVRSSLDLGPDPALIVPRSRVAYVPSAALLVRRAAADAGFDEGMHVAEDVDLVLRLHAAGWRLRYEPAARVAHDHRTSLRAWWLRKAFYGTGAAPLALRHRGAVPPMVLSPWARAHQRAAAGAAPGRGGGGVGGRRVPPVHQARPPAPPARDRGPADRARRGRGRRADRRRRHPALLAARRAGRARLPPRPPHGRGRRARQRRRRLAARGPRAARPARVPAGPPPRRPRLRRGPLVGCRSAPDARPAPARRHPPRGLLRKTESAGAGLRFCGVRTAIDPRSRTRSPSVFRQRELGRTAVVAPVHDRRCDVLATTVLRPRGSPWHRSGSPSTA